MPSNETAIELFFWPSKAAVPRRSQRPWHAVGGSYSDGSTRIGITAWQRSAPSDKPGGLPTYRRQEASFKARFLADPTEADGVCTLRGKEAQRILKEEFGVEYMAGVYDLLAWAFLPGPATAS